MMVVDTVGAIFSSKSNIGFQHMGGPVMMMRAYYMMFENPEGWRLALWFSVVLNVNLGLLNMLPFPVLDGGHIVLALIEGARRRPLNARFLEFGPDRLRPRHHQLHGLHHVLRRAGTGSEAVGRSS
jgi:regulator of sigma E protease